MAPCLYACGHAFWVGIFPLIHTLGLDYRFRSSFCFIDLPPLWWPSGKKLCFCAPLLSPIISLCMFLWSPLPLYTLLFPMVRIICNALLCITGEKQYRNFFCRSLLLYKSLWIFSRCISARHVHQRTRSKLRQLNMSYATRTADAQHCIQLCEGDMLTMICVHHIQNGTLDGQI